MPASVNPGATLPSADTIGAVTQILRPVDPARGSPRGPVLLTAGAFVVALSVTLMFLGMRSVMDVGGMCASGGPYEIATPCPDVAGPTLTLGIFGWFAGAGLLVWGSGSLGGAWRIAPVLAWSALFGALGWNFLEYAFAFGGVELGWLIPGVVFEAMAIVPLAVVAVPAAAVARGTRGSAAPDLRDVRPVTAESGGGMRRPSPGGAAKAGSASGRAYEPAAHDDGTFSLPDPGAAWSTAGDHGATGSPDGPTDLVAALEGLAALHDRGALTDEEYARAKEAVIDAAGGGQ